MFDNITVGDSTSNHIDEIVNCPGQRILYTFILHLEAKKKKENGLRNDFWDVLWDTTHLSQQSQIFKRRFITGANKIGSILYEDFVFPIIPSVRRTKEKK